MGDRMDNYELAMMGVKIASEILHINAPEVRFLLTKIQMKEVLMQSLIQSYIL